MKILVSIVSWNALNEVDELLPAIIAADGFTFAIAENGCKEYDFSTFSNLKEDQVTFLKENNGYAAGHWENIQNYGEFDGVLILNTDIYLFETILTNLKKTILSTENKCIIGAPVYNKQRSLHLEYGGYPINSEHKSILENATISNHRITVPRHITYNVNDLHGCFFYIPSWCIKNYGWMDLSYFLYGEENDYFWRLRKNVPLKIDSNLAILHKDGGSFQASNDILQSLPTYYRTRNKLYNLKKHYGRIKALKNLNISFIVKYFFGRYILNKSHLKQKDKNYFDFKGRIDFLLNRRGKVFDPNNYL